MSELEEEISRRARRLLAAQGEPNPRANSPDYRSFDSGRLSMELNHDKDCEHEYLMVWLRNSSNDTDIIYREADGIPATSFYKLQNEQRVALGLMRDLMVLDDLADV